MRIAVIGTGNIGSTLGTRWSEAGHDVVYGARAVRDDGPGGARVRLPVDAITGADVVVLALPGRAVADLVAGAGPVLDGKVVVDATNRMGAESYNALAEISAGAPNARYVRAFNTLGWENFAAPPAGADLFYAADEEEQAIAEELIAAVGVRPVRVGGVEATPVVDSLLPLWFALMQRRGDRHFAFRVVD